MSHPSTHLEDLDWEEFENNWASPALTQHLGSLAYPINCISLSKVSKNARTVQSFNKQASKDISSSYLDYFNHYYGTTEWIQVCEKLDETKRMRSKSKTKRKSKALIFENEAYEIKDEGATLIDYSSKKKSLANMLSEKRIISHYNMAKPKPIHLLPELESLEDTRYELKHALMSSTRLLLNSRFEFGIRVESMTFEIGVIEPLFGTIALYDIVNKTKITEDYHFQTNNKDLLDMANLKMRDPLAKSSSAIFSVDPQYKNSQVYLIVTIKKVLKGDIDSLWDAYIKGQDLKAKEKTKITEELKDSVQALHSYRQCFLYASTPLFTETGELFHEGEVSLDSFVRAKHDIHSYMDDIKKDRKDKKEILGSLKMNISKQFSRINRVDASLSSVIPFDEKDDARHLEVFGFESPSPVARMAMNYVNNIYIYPEKLYIDSLSSSTSLRNIAIEFKVLAQDTKPDGPGLPFIYSNTTRGLVDKEMTSVWYHTKRPRFHDEIKIKIPFVLSDQHHILLTFYHINCKGGKSSKLGIETPFGYAVILFKRSDGILKPNRHYTANIVSKLPENYLSANICGDEFEDKAKNSLTYTAQVVSSIHPKDEKIFNFLTKASNLIKYPEADIIEALNLLNTQANTHEVIKFLPSIFHQLFTIIASEKKSLSDKAFETWILLHDKICKEDPKQGPSMLRTYIEKVFDHKSNKSISYAYDAICDSWIRFHKSENQNADITLTASWFIFMIMTKSMNLRFDEMKLLNDESTRTTRLTVETKNSLMLLMSVLSSQISKRLEDPFYMPLRRRFTIHLANFFTQLSLTCDRGFVFSLIAKYMKAFQSITLDVVGMKCLLVKVMAQHPNFFQLNFPVQPQFKTSQEMIRTFQSRHYIIGILINAIDTSFKAGVGAGGSDHMKIREITVDTLCEIFYNIEDDSKWNTSIDKMHIACMFWPFTSLVIDKWDLVLSMSKDEKRKNLICFVWLLYNIPRGFLEFYWEREAEKRISRFFEITRKILEEFEYEGQEIVVLKRKGKPIINSFFDMEALASDHRFATLRKEPVEESKRKKDKKKSISNSSTHEVITLVKKSSTRIFSDDENVKKESEMCSIISGTILDIIILFMRKFSPALQRIEIFTMIWTPIVDFMRYNQSLEFISVLFESISVVLKDFGSHLFKKSNSICSDLTHQTLRKCNSTSLDVRQYAITFFVELVRINLKEVNNVFRSQLQSTIAIIKIVGDSKTKDFSRLINTLSKASKEVKKTELGQEISDVLSQIEEKAHRVIQDSIKIQEHQHDPETLTDVQYDISLHLGDSPDERLSWLENLSKHHLALKNYEESAQTKIVMAGLVQNYLKLLDRWETKMVPAFQHVCPNIEDDIKMDAKLSHLKLLGNELCQSSMFSNEGFVKLLREAINLLKEGEFYESCVAAYRMILPVFYENDDYSKQKSCYDDLSSLCQKILDVNTMQQRIFSNYYRVSYYGKLMGPDMDGVEFIYKEPPTIRVADMTEKILQQYKNKYGEENVVLVANNSTVPPQATRDPKKIYIQLCNVELFLPKEQLEEKNTGFKQHFGATRFVMEQPFTKKGGAQGSLEDQFIRRTYFTTERKFPFLKKRLKVIHVEEEELSPIDCAISLIEKRVRALRTELNLSPPNLKNLQRELQGCLLTQVNAGPIAVIQLFLANEKASLYSEEKRAHLATNVNELERALGFAVKLNKNSIDSSENQLILQEEFEKGYVKLKGSFIGYSIFDKLRDIKKEQEEKQRLKLLEIESKTLLEKKNSFGSPRKKDLTDSQPEVDVTLLNRVTGSDKPVKEKMVRDPSIKNRGGSTKEKSIKETSSKEKIKPTKEKSNKNSTEEKKPKKMMLSKSQKTIFNKQEIAANRQRFHTMKSSTTEPERPLSPTSEEERERLREERQKKKEEELRRTSKVQEETRIRTSSLRSGTTKLILPPKEISPIPLPLNEDIELKKKLQSSISKVVLVVEEVSQFLKHSMERVHIALELEELRPMATSLKNLKMQISSMGTIIPFEEPESVKPVPNEDKLEYFKDIVMTEIQNGVARLSRFVVALKKVEDSQLITEVVKIIIPLKKNVTQM